MRTELVRTGLVRQFCSPFSISAFAAHFGGAFHENCFRPGIARMYLAGFFWSGVEFQSDDLVLVAGTLRGLPKASPA